MQWICHLRLFAFLSLTNLLGSGNYLFLVGKVLLTIINALTGHAQICNDKLSLCQYVYVDMYIINYCLYVLLTYPSSVNKSV